VHLCQLVVDSLHSLQHATWRLLLLLQTCLHSLPCLPRSECTALMRELQGFGGPLPDVTFAIAPAE
jgi:hypothetical protein